MVLEGCYKCIIALAIGIYSNLFMGLIILISSSGDSINLKIYQVVIIEIIIEIIVIFIFTQGLIIAHRGRNLIDLKEKTLHSNKIGYEDWGLENIKEKRK